MTTILPVRQLRSVDRTTTQAVMPTRRQFLFGVAATGLLVACGNTDDGAATETVGHRTVTTDNGPLAVPAVPRRVVAAIGSFETDMVAVGFMPVLTSSFTMGRVGRFGDHHREHPPHS